MKKTVLKAFILLFLLLSLVPSIGMLFVGEAKPSANEILAFAPRMHLADGSLNPNVLKESTDYVADRFAFRKPLITAWAELNAALLHSSSEEQVVLGKEGWLYYSATLDDYMGRSLSDAELETAAMNLSALQAYAENHGIRFIFTVAPNKNSLYAENMPVYIPAAHEDSNIERLKPCLARFGVNYVDLIDVLSDREELLYYRTDSHWTDKGAALAADTLLDALGKESAFFEADFAVGSGHRGDLYEMLYPTGNRLEESFVYTPGFHYSVSGDAKGGDALKIKTDCENADGSLVCWRDSFGISLYPYLAESFGEALFLRSDKYDLTQAVERGADTVIIEIVERNLPRLVNMEVPQTGD